MSILLQWFLNNSMMILGGLLALVAYRYRPNIQSWQAFLDSFESKGGQLMLLWVTDFIVLAVLVHYWKGFDAQLQTTIVGLLSGVNGAFLGAIGARNTNVIGGGAVGPVPAADEPPTQPPRAAPAATSSSTAPVSMGFAPSRQIGDVGERGTHGDLGTNNLRGSS